MAKASEFDILCDRGSPYRCRRAAVVKKNLKRLPWIATAFLVLWACSRVNSAP